MPRSIRNRDMRNRGGDAGGVGKWTAVWHDRDVPASPPDARDAWSRGDDEVADTGGRRSRRVSGSPPAPGYPGDRGRDDPDIGSRHGWGGTGPAERRGAASGDEWDGIDFAPARRGSGVPYPPTHPADDETALLDEYRDDDPEYQSDGPVVPPVPARRGRSLAVAGLSALVAIALIVGAQLTGQSYAFVVFGVQALFIATWTVASQPPAPRIVAGVGLGVAIAADLASALVTPASLASLAYLTAAGFVAGVIGQLMRPAGRVRVTESLGSTLIVVLGVIAFATLVVLSRAPLGAQVILACLLGAGVALVVAHGADLVVPVPRVAATVPRGGIGVVLGAMVGTAAAGLAGYFLDGLLTLPTALAGLAAAGIALMVDMSADYAEVGRQLAGQSSSWWLVRHMQGPLTAFALAAPTAYAADLLLARGL
jgi:hypothetical protein